MELLLDLWQRPRYFLNNQGQPHKAVDLTAASLPDIDWIPIPTGAFIMGEEKARRLLARPYLISRYPITVAQYQAFVNAGGYSEAGKRYWTDRGWKWRTSSHIDDPEDFDPVFQTANPSSAKIRIDLETPWSRPVRVKSVLSFQPGRGSIFRHSSKRGIHPRSGDTGGGEVLLYQNAVEDYYAANR